MENQHFERSKRIVRVSVHEGRLELKSPMGRIPRFEVENVECFRCQIEDGDFLVLERRGVGHYKILGIVKNGCVLHEIYEIVEEYGLDFGFPESVESEAASYIDGEIDFDGCDDMRDVPFVTVDGAGTRDLDQALYVGTPGDGLDHWIREVEPSTQYVAWYAIADAAWFVRPGSALFEGALERGASIYFAGMSVSMLPAALSQGLISLNANVDRRALVFIMQVSSDGICLRTDMRRARVRSRAKLASGDVSAFLRDPENHLMARAEYAQSLKNFKALGLLRMAESRKRNVVHFNRVALDVGLNGAKTGFTLGLDDRIDADMYNEQLSLLCNMEGASILNRLAKEDPGVLAIFRNHEAPSLHHVEDLCEEMHALARAQHLPPVWFWDMEKQSLSDYFDGLPRASCRPNIEDPEEIRLFRIRQAMERLVLMMQRRSVFSPEAGLHSALGVNPYARFSAPMREIVGIFTHKEAVEAEFGGDGKLSREENALLRERVIESANDARRVQRDIDKAVDSCAIAHVVSMDYDLPPSRRPHRRGTILGRKPSALYVRLDMPPIELKVYVRDMAEISGQAWTVNEDRTVIARADGAVSYTVGDSMEVVVSSFEPTKKKWRVVNVQ